MKTQKLSYFIIASAMFVTLLNSSCKKNYGPGYTTPPASGLTGVELSDNAQFGKVITDNNGRSLYFFSNDAAATSNCADGCSVTWPTFYESNPVIGTGLAATDFSVITRHDGTKQTTYKGWPLYYFAGDAKAGDTKGDAIDNLWAIAKADYTVMFANAQLVGLDSLKYNSQGLPGEEVSQYITDANGHTLYLFTHDTFKHNTFTKEDFTNNNVWPIDTLTAVGSIPTVLEKAQFDVITTFGKTQLEYKGHPIYYFGKDNATRGNTKGVSAPTPGAAIFKIANKATVALQ